MVDKNHREKSLSNQGDTTERTQRKHRHHRIYRILPALQERQCAFFTPSLSAEPGNTPNTPSENQRTHIRASEIREYRPKSPESQSPSQTLSPPQQPKIKPQQKHQTAGPHRADRAKPRGDTAPKTPADQQPGTQPPSDHSDAAESPSPPPPPAKPDPPQTRGSGS